MQRFEQLEHSRLSLIEAALRFVKRTCVLGASNRQEDMEKTGGFVSKALRHFGKEVPSWTTISFQESIFYEAYCALICRAGTCAEQTALAMFFLLSCGENSIYRIDFGIGVGREHICLAVGLEENSDLLDPESIPVNAYILDPWNNEYYPAKDLIVKRAEKNASSKLITRTPTIRLILENGLKSTHFGVDSSSPNFKQQLKDFLTAPKRCRPNPPRSPYSFLAELTQKSVMDSSHQTISCLNKLSSDKLSAYKEFRFFQTRRKAGVNELSEWAGCLFWGYIGELKNKKENSEIEFEQFDIYENSFLDVINTIPDETIDSVLASTTYTCRFSDEKADKIARKKFGDYVNSALKRNVKFSDWYEAERSLKNWKFEFRL